MSNKMFIPELHDIGKLISYELKEELKNEEIKIDHTFEDFDFTSFGLIKPSSPSWWGQYHHVEQPYKITEENLNHWNFAGISAENKQDLFLLILADHLASSTSRAIYDRFPGQKGEEGIVKLWNLNFYDKHVKQAEKGKQKEYWAVFKTPDEVKDIIDEIENCISSEDFLNKYRKNLLLTPEDKFSPRNVTSLFTHVELVGKIYRVLKKHTRIVTEPSGEIAIEYVGIKVVTVTEAEGSRKTTEEQQGKWQTKFVKCEITFPHAFVRLHDINLLRKRVELIQRAQQGYRDEILFTAPNFVVLFLPKGADLQAILQPFLKAGFHIKVTETTADLGILNSILDQKALNARKDKQQNQNLPKRKGKKPESEKRAKALEKRATKVYQTYLLPEIPPEMPSPLCDICQQSQGILREEENIREWVCRKCQGIRDIGEPFKEYGEIWERKLGITRVGWFKFALDQEKLEQWLTDYAFSGHIMGVPSQSEYKTNVLSPMRDEYNRLQVIREELETRRDQLKQQQTQDGADKRALGMDIAELDKQLTPIRDQQKQLCDELNVYDEEFRPLALQIDFNYDYKAMLKAFWQAFKDTEDIQKPLAEYDELGVFKYSPGLTNRVIKTFKAQFEEFFPNCADNQNSPISLSLSIANIKYPIRDHWKYFEQENKSWLNLRSHNVFEETYTKAEVEKIFENLVDTRVSQSYLHNLIETYEKLQSDTYLSLEVFNNRKTYPKPYQLLTAGISPARFLNFYRIVKGIK